MSLLTKEQMYDIAVDVLGEQDISDKTCTKTDYCIVMHSPDDVEKLYSALQYEDDRCYETYCKDL